jgi:hypothetical protein
MSPSEYDSSIPYHFASDPFIPPSQRPVVALRARAGELRRMAQTATSAHTEAALVMLAQRFDALADKRAAERPSPAESDRSDDDPV